MSSTSMPGSASKAWSSTDEARMTERSLSDGETAWLKRAEVLALAAALVLGIGVGALAPSTLTTVVVPLLLIGCVGLAWGMVQGQRLEHSAPTMSRWLVREFSALASVPSPLRHLLPRRCRSSSPAASPWPGPWCRSSASKCSAPARRHFGSGRPIRPVGVPLPSPAQSSSGSRSISRRPRLGRRIWTSQISCAARHSILTVPLQPQSATGGCISSARPNATACSPRIPSSICRHGCGRKHQRHGNDAK